MEAHQHRNKSAMKQWQNWRSDRSLFEGIGSEDLRHKPECNVQWTRGGVGAFTARKQGERCVFNFTHIPVRK